MTSQDYFGHKVQLNFNKKGSEHQTLIGGIVSIFINAMMIVYVTILLKRMFLFEDDDVSTATGVINFQDFNGVKMSELSNSIAYSVT